MSDVVANTPLTARMADVARAYGVATEYWDWQGRHVHVSRETIDAVLAALGVQVGDDLEAKALLEERATKPWRQTLPPFTILRHGNGRWLPVHLPHGMSVSVWIDLEDGLGIRELEQVDHWVDPREVDGALVGEATFAIPDDLPLGWHRLNAAISDGPSARADLVVVPQALELPPGIGEHGGFGLMTQVYAVRSRRSWGVGDLTDLSDLASWSARELGADFILVNPLHAAEPVPPMEPSPYLPVSRRFVNPLYIRVEDIPEVAYLPPKQRASVERRAAKARELNFADRIDRDAAWKQKSAALRAVFEAPLSPHRKAALDAFREREGQGLVDFARWCALAERHGSEIGGWPEELKDPRGPAVEKAVAKLADSVDFYTWLQWIVDEQLEAVQRGCVTAGMALGVMTDMAVGVHPEGADVWSLADVLADGVTVGAPPDAFNQLGQNWSQPPWRPDRLADAGYRPFRDMIRASLRHAGALRIDHIIGLFRLWWVPEGRLPLEGTYVRLDHEALIGILMLEAHRAGAVVVGEDLGTVEPWVRDYLRSCGILGTSILWFERTDDDRPRAAEDYRRLCLSSVTTHDLPPTAGYLSGEHIQLRADLNLFTRPVEVERAEDEAERQEIIEMLRGRGLLSADPEEDTLEGVTEALHRFLSWSPSLLIGVAVADLVGDRRVLNQPGTDEEYPNWRLPLAGPDRTPLLLEDVLANKRGRRLTKSVHRGRRPQ